MRRAPGVVTSPIYSPAARTLHWLTAACVLGLLIVGPWMVGLPISLLKLQAYAWHKWIGLTVLALTVVRLAWRWHAPPPPLPSTVTAWERRLAPLSHGLLLGLLVAQPLVGWLMSSAGGVTVYWFGYLPLPDAVPRDPQIFAVLRATHRVLGYTLMGVVTLHMLAVIRHDVLRRDGIFRRMWI